MNKLIFRGISDKELKSYLKGIPKGKRFTTDIFMARKHGPNVIGVPFNKKKFLENGQSDVFKRLRIKERYYFNKNPIKKFSKLMMLD